MALDENIYELRRAKLKQIEALGQRAYPTKYEYTHTIPQILTEYSGKTGEELEQNRVEVRVAGRVMANRLMGKAGFVHLQQGGQKLQVYVKKDAVGERGFELYLLLDLGDHIGVKGYLFRTRTGELTVHVDEITFLSKDLLPLPEKWHGLTDVELRYRQRYVDLVMNPEVRDVFLKRSKLVQSLRRYFDSQGFVEVETPMMHPIAGGAVAKPFVTHHNTLDMDLFLRIAPELYLKRLTVGGFDRVFEINRNFRNEGISFRHNPEFTMLEAYQAYTDYLGIMETTQGSIEQAVKDVSAGTKTQWGEQEIDWSHENWRRMTMREAILEFWPEKAGHKPQHSDFGSPAIVGSMVGQLRNAGVDLAYDSNAPAGKTIANIFEAVAEEHLMQPTIIYEFPTAVSPLSKQKPDEPDWTERFEMYAGQMEIANGFSELNDPVEQRRRFEAEQRSMQTGGKRIYPLPEKFLDALERLPPCAGNALGIDRLVMLFCDAGSIGDVVTFTAEEL
ncbi:MAG TPA: lysine--tRNA ligase [Terriglobales bacterium]|nr:lysine--tRNA ligase [Terriglobales bacterium]